MQIWIDADACPKPVKETLFRASARRRVALVLVANAPIAVPKSSLIRCVQVAGGFDVADNEIAARVQPGDLVVTADIPLAAQVIERGATALDPRGELYTADNVKSRLSVRNFMADLRSAGVDAGGARPWHARDTQAFANALDRWLARQRPSSAPAAD